MRVLALETVKLKRGDLPAGRMVRCTTELAKEIEANNKGKTFLIPDKDFPSFDKDEKMREYKASKKSGSGAGK